MIVRHPLECSTNTVLRWDALKDSGLLPDVGGREVLDVGCGLGYFSVQFHKLGARVTAVDLDERALAYLQSAHGIAARKMDVLRLDLPAGTYAVIFAGEVLEHIEQPLALLRRLRELLIPGGTLIISTPALEGMFTDTRGKRLGHDDGTEKHARDGFRREELAQLLQEAGLGRPRFIPAIYWCAELFFQLTKLSYLANRRGYRQQSDILDSLASLKYRALRLLFPVLHAGFHLEQRLAAAAGAGGHCHIMVTERQRHG